MKITLENKFGYNKEYNLQLKKGETERDFLKQATKEKVERYLNRLAPIQQTAYKLHYGLEGKPEDLKSVAEKMGITLEKVVALMDMGLGVMK